MDNKALYKDPVLGAIVGDIVGSRFEFKNGHAPENFELFGQWCRYTDDTVLTLAVAKAIMDSNGDYEHLRSMVVRNMLSIGKKHLDCGFGESFENWLLSYYHDPYNSFGNGAAMRVSACGMLSESLEETKELSQKVTDITHNHPDGIRGAEATAVIIYLIKSGMDKDELKELFKDQYYPIDFTVEDLIKSYGWNLSCAKTVPQAFECFYESVDYEDAIRKAISIGGDTDTVGAIAGSMAAMYHGVPENLRVEALKYLSDDLSSIYEEYSDFVLKKTYNNSSKR